MSLAPPLHTEVYSTLDALMQAVNAYAKDHGYAITKRRTGSGKTGISQAVLFCDRGRQYQERIPLEFKQRSTGTGQTL
ncbi:MAG: Glucose-6-phosphate 1-dehydrogenase [Watsoniomyces obsoletus]|nr:MAG: Glucose-6-phosphate 1-dehydrogenase [Watsoniomyces obsoletus]